MEDYIRCADLQHLPAEVIGSYEKGTEIATETPFVGSTSIALEL